jgi:signal transduction histidine kinase
VITLRDVTARQRAEMMVCAKNQELETLLRVLAHDLREPLRSIETFSSLLEQEQGGGLAPQACDYLQRIMRSSRRMSRQLTDIMQLAQARELTPPSEMIDFSAVVAEVLSALEHEIADSGARVCVAAPLPFLKAEKTWAVLAVHNLVVNALKFTRTSQAPDIEIAPYSDGAAPLGISVRDRGPGVDPMHTKRIFNIFQRAVGREISGNGARLAIVHAVAEKHGGRAWVLPREGGGSEFIVTFGTTT